jgi:hypothetical protein
MVLAGDAVPAGGALTTPACLAKKLKAWGKLRNCQATENGKALQGKQADAAKCQMTFEDNLAKLNAKATKAAVGCRYGDNGDGTVTDYDTGLQWEQKTEDGSVHDRNNIYSWCRDNNTDSRCDDPLQPPDGSAFTAFLGTLNKGTSSDGTATSGCFAGHCDWRLPAIEELAGIVDPSASGCASGSPCIDVAVFGQIVTFPYWSATTRPPIPLVPEGAWEMNFFFGGNVSSSPKPTTWAVRAVRSGL